MWLVNPKSSVENFRELFRSRRTPSVECPQYPCLGLLSMQTFEEALATLIDAEGRIPEAIVNELKRWHEDTVLCAEFTRLIDRSGVEILELQTALSAVQERFGDESGPAVMIAARLAGILQETFLVGMLCGIRMEKQ
jgi:hypothetical protein